MNLDLVAILDNATPSYRLRMAGASVYYAGTESEPVDNLDLARKLASEFATLERVAFEIVFGAGAEHTRTVVATVKPLRHANTRYPRH